MSAAIQAFVVIPAYNEGTVVSEVVAGVCSEGLHVVVVDDGSADDTAAAARRGGARVVRHAINLGQGAALQTGITHALRCGASHVVTFDADGQMDPKEILPMIAALDQADAQVALGSRFFGDTIGMPTSRRLLLQAARLVNLAFTGLYLSDAHNGMRAFTREAALRLRLRQPGMAHATEVVAQIAQARLRFVEVPVTIRYTEYSMAKGQRLGNSVHILLDLLLRGLLR
jgi:glycosyltransferase involved in cell wall biosynthesis